MTCYYPLTAWRSKNPNKSGKHSLVFKSEDAKPLSELQIPCGRCIGCRLEYARQWAVRCMHESTLHEANSFITLTYDEAHLPYDHGLRKPDFQKFMKRLRKRINKPIKYFMCGEYGESATRRPHYHACIFGYDFPDKQYYKNSSSGLPLYLSPTLTKTWRKGHCDIGHVTFESASYVASYITKKLLGKDKDSEEYYKYYNRVDPDTGEEFIVEPEYVTMSRGGNVKGSSGIGKRWIEQYQEDTWRDDMIVVNGRPQLPPKYYLEQLEDEDKKKDIRRARRAHAATRNNNVSLEDLQREEKVRKLNMIHKRNLNEGI